MKAARRVAASAPDWVRDGALCWYQPIVMKDQPRYAAVVDGEPWQLGHGEWVVNLRDLDDDYRRVVRDRSRVNAACMFALAPRGAA